MTQVWDCRGDRHNAGNRGIAGRSRLGLGNPVVRFGTDAQPARTLEPMIGEHKKPVSNTSKFKTAAAWQGRSTRRACVESPDFDGAGCRQEDGLISFYTS
ncbi:MAG: hypothetical protein ABJQ00_13355 [Nitratireductor sp.]|jgi:hypothetical protein|uniref:hypothetical protein n=1 Tax=Sulfitobacter sp. TaxID=1903071 RepID=UPI000E0B737B|nr:hypothetical protein C1J04_16295 [Sulfitobacter sp. SK025]|tara:strand:+ start:320 stop:619 length:300 start_codon:yes stop_codon:yes gene_type:complete